MNTAEINLGLVIHDGRAVVSSRDIARVFERRHDNVLRDIRNIIDDDAEWGLLNFEETPYTDAQNGQTYRAYSVTRDGFTILVMGYTGDSAMTFKKAYIAAFNEMEHRLAAPALPTNYKEALLALVAAEEERKELAERNRALEIPAAKYEAQTDTAGLYYIGEIAESLGTTAVVLNRFLHDKHIQYRPDGSKTWRLYADHVTYGYAVPRLVKLKNGRDVPVLVWTAKGRDYIYDLMERERPDWYA